MRYWSLVWGSVMSRKWAYLATFAALVLCFILSSYMLAFSRAMSRGVQLSGTQRLVVWHKTSIIELLPLSYVDEVAKLDDVVAVTHRSFFGGYYRDPGNQLPMWVVDPGSFMRYYPEYSFGTPAQAADFLAGGEAIAVGRAAADALGWKQGDRVPVHSVIWTKKDDSDVWMFRVAAIVDSKDPSANTRQVFIPYGAFNEARAFGKNGVGYIEVMARSDAASPALAKRIDAHFESSAKPTHTSTLSGFLQSFASQIGEISSLVYSAMAIVVVTVLMMLVGQLAHGFSLRRKEFGVLKTIGYDNLTISGLIVGESVALSFFAALIGLIVAGFSINASGPMVAKYLSGFYQTPSDMAVVALLALAMGLLASALPVLQARSILSALR